MPLVLEYARNRCVNLLFFSLDATRTFTPPNAQAYQQLQLDCRFLRVVLAYFLSDASMREIADSMLDEVGAEHVRLYLLDDRSKASSGTEGRKNEENYSVCGLNFQNLNQT